MLKVIITFVFALTNILCFAGYTDRGRPIDFEEDHDGPLSYLFMGVGAIIVVGFIIFWIYDKITTHKEQVSAALGQIFAGLFAFGGILLISKCGEEIHNKINTNKNEQVETVENSALPEGVTPVNASSTYPYTSTQQSPILHYRTVEYYENCYNCSGSGTVVCPHCKGSGKYTKVCGRCNGSGGHYKSFCSLCNGQGYHEDLTFGTGRHSCISCNGTGYVNNSCGWCGGSGQETVTCDIYAFYGQRTHMVGCPVCNGSGKIRKTKQESYYE